MANPLVEQVARGDGGAMDMFVWEPESAPTAAMLLIQEIFGVGPYIRAVAERLAGLGYLVGAPDVFWRFAPHWESPHTADGLQSSVGKVQSLDFPLAIEDCGAALQQLKGHPGIERAGVIGFCLGGTLAWGVAGTGVADACVSYYGSGVPSMIDLCGTVTCPTLFHFGNNDPYLPSEGVDALAAAVAGKDNFVINVEIAGHAFDNHEAPMFWNEAAARAAWAKTVAFLETELPSS